MYKIAHEIEHAANHEIPLDKIHEHVNNIIRHRANFGLDNEAIKRWNRECAPLGLGMKREIRSVGTAGMHDLRFAAAQAKDLYQVFQKKILNRTYGADKIKYVHKGYPKEIDRISHALNTEEIQRFSRTAQKHMQKHSSNLLM